MLYNLGIYLFGLVLKIIGLFNSKAKKGNEGRSKSLNILKSAITPQARTIWFHCASLGEYEQGLPVFSELRTRYPKHKIVITFFSPSGYETRKNSRIADLVIYLPIDTPKNARNFVKYLHPELAIFVKYEIWANYLLELNKVDCKTYLIAALFRKKQIYFKWYGTKLRTALKSFETIFVQNKQSEELLRGIQITNFILAGDTRFDRVSQHLEIDNQLDWLNEFKGDNLLMVFGSTWPEDEELLLKYINQSQNARIKFLVVPHEISENHIRSIEKNLERPFTRFTKPESNIASKSVLILDAIGYLSRCYANADLAFIGGAVGKTGLHNILEAAVFGIPIIIGPNYKKFPEAHQLSQKGGLVSIKNYTELSQIFTELIAKENLRKSMGKISENFVKNNTGSVIQITKSIRI